MAGLLPTGWYEATERPVERALRRKLRRRALAEALGLGCVAVLAALLLGLFLAATPPQSGAVNDLEAGTWEVGP